jgi:hypothetical protein
VPIKCGRLVAGSPSGPSGIDGLSDPSDRSRALNPQARPALLPALAGVITRKEAIRASSAPRPATRPEVDIYGSCVIRVTVTSSSAAQDRRGSQVPPASARSFDPRLVRTSLPFTAVQVAHNGVGEQEEERCPAPTRPY